MKLTTFSVAIGRYLVAFSALLGLGPLQTLAFAADPIYVVSVSAGFYKVDLATGTRSLLGSLPQVGGLGLYAIAFKPGTSQLYGLVTTDFNTTWNVAQLFPDTQTLVLASPPFTTAQLPLEMAFSPDGAVYTTGPGGEIRKVDLNAGTLSTIRPDYSPNCGVDFSCPSGLAWLNGSLIQAQIGTGNNPNISGLTIQYLSVDPVTGTTAVLSTGTLPDTNAAYQSGTVWLDTDYLGTLYLGAANNNGPVWGIAGPSSATFTQLLGFGSFLAVIPTHFAISGQATLGGVAFSGVTVTLGGSQTGTTTTDANGNYSFPNLLGTGSYTVTPSLSGYNFTPPNAALSTFSSDQTANFAAALVASPALSISKTHSGDFIKGQSGAMYDITVSNALAAGPSAGTVTVTDTIPSGLTLVSMAGTGWNCVASTCTRGDALAGGASYASITVIVNVSGKAPAQVTNRVSLSGGGSQSANASDLTNIASANPHAAPDLVITQFSAPTSGNAGTQLSSLAVAVQNQGSAAAGPFRIGIYLSKNSSVSTKDAFLGVACSVTALNVAQTTSCTTGSVTIPASVAPGLYYIAAIADDLRQVKESHESKNTRASDNGPITVH